MRFRLLLSVNSSADKNHVPINYQYELSSWIYQTINQSDGEFSKWLHDTGHTRQNRKFKLFTFSQLVPGKYAVEGDRLTLLSDQVILTVSFYLPKAVEYFVTGLFRKQQFRLGDRVSSVDFSVRQVEKLPESGLVPVGNIKEGVDATVRMELKGQPRQKLVKIKAGTTEQVFLKGYLFEFGLTAPVELMRIGYYGGFGEKNSLGFGCCEVLKT